MSPGFFLNIAKNTGNKFSYEILPVKDLVDIPTRNIWPIVQNILRSRSLDCSNAPIIKENNNYFIFWNAKGEELLSGEELDPQYIPDRYEDIPYVTKDEIRQLTSDQPSGNIDIKDRDTLAQIDGINPTIPEEPSKNSLLVVSEEQSNDNSSPQCEKQVPECLMDIS